MPSDSPPYEVHIFYGRLNVEGRRAITHVDHERHRIVVSIHPADSDADRLAALAFAIRDELIGPDGEPLRIGEVRIVPASG